jgi:FkbM family methyltransferase
MSFLTKSLKARIRQFLPRSVGPHSILAGPLQGASIYTSWHDYPGAILGTTEKPLIDWFRRNVSPGETWIDVGAHYGYTAIALCHLVGATGRVVAFEPVLSTAGCVAHTRRLNGLRQLQIVPVGLSSCITIETHRLPVIRGMADSTIPQTIWEERISVASFDTVWSFLCEGNPLIHGVKIDVQGMELGVIKGMRDTLASYRPKVIVEFHAGVDRRAVIGLLDSCGYAGSGEPIEPEAAGPRCYANDKSYAFYCRNQAAVREGERMFVGNETSEEI